MHDLLQPNFATLSAAFSTYAKSLGESSGDASAATMNLEEFNDFVVDVGLETAEYKFAQMGAIFTRANASTKGAAGPKADTELQLHEFLSALVRVSFWRLNPTYGQQEKEGLGKKPQADFTPVPNALRLALNNCVLPNARTDADGAGFRQKEWKDAQVQAALRDANESLADWFKGLTLDPAVSSSKLGMAQWVSLLEGLNAVGGEP